MDLFRRILVPLDGSPLSESILPAVLRLADRAETELILIRAIAAYPIAGLDYPFFLEEWHDEVHRYLGEAVLRLKSTGFRARYDVPQGDPAEAIVRSAGTERASLVAMCTHGRTGAGRWLLGSVAERVLRACHAPMLVGKPEGAVRLEKILVPLDGSARSAQVLPVAAEFARRVDGKLTLLHVAGGCADRDRADPFEAVDAEAHRLEAGGVPADPRVLRVNEARLADPAAVIVDYAREGEFDVIAMATHGRSGVERWALGSVTERVLRGAARPMLIERVVASPTPA